MANSFCRMACWRWRKKRNCRHAIEGAGILGGVRHSRDDCGEGLVVEANLSEEADLGIDFDDVGKFLDFLAGIFVENARRLIGIWAGTTARRTSTRATEIIFGSDDDGVEETALREALAGKFLKADAERKHGDQ